MFVKMHGSMDDLHNFMLEVDNPVATRNMAITLAGMAKEKSDAINLIRYSNLWKGRAEGRLIQSFLLRKAGSLDGISAVTRLMNLSDGNVTSDELGAVLGGAVSNDAQTVREWMNAQGKEMLSKDSKSAVLSQLALQLPIADVVGDAIRASNGSNEDLRWFLTTGVFSSQAVQKNPRAAAEFIETTSAIGEDTKSHLAQIVAVNWSGTDLMGASGWIAELPHGQVRDRATYGLLNSIHNSKLDMPETLEWVNSIGDEKLRAAASKWFSQQK